MKRFMSMLVAVLLVISVFPAVAENEEVINYEDVQVSINEEAGKSEDEREVRELKMELSSEEENNISLLSQGTENAVISGKVLLPEGASVNEGDQMEIAFYESPEISGGRVMSEGSSSVKKEEITLSSGQTEASFSSALPDGDYIIRVRYTTGNKSINGAYAYYTGDGMTENEYLAKSIKAGSADAQNLTMTLLKAESYISGTIDLTNSVPEEDTYICMRAEAPNGAHYQYVYVSTLAKKGESSCSYEIGLDKELFQLQFSSDLFKSGYYSSGTLESSYQKRSILDTKEPIENLDVKIDEQSDINNYNIKINFEKPLSEERVYIVDLVSFEGNNLDSYTLIDDEWIDAPKGATSMSVSFPIRKDYEKMFLMYREITFTSNVDYAPDRVSYYYSQEKGITTDPSLATNIKGMTNIEVTEPEFVSVKGVLNIKGDAVNTGSLMHVGADFGSESYSDIVKVTGRENSFEIKVPKRLVGKSFTVFTGIDRFSYLNEKAIVSSNVSYTLSENMQSLSVDSAEFTALNGKIVLPFEAPKSGATVDVSLYIDQYWVSFGKFVMAEGEKELSYTIAVPASIKERAEISATLRIYEDENISKEFRSERFTSVKDIDIIFYETAELSGTISLPDGVTFESETSVYLYIQGEKENTGAYFSIPAGENSAPYSLKIAKNQNITYMYIWLPEEKGDLFRYSYYDGSGNMSGTGENISVPVTGDMALDLSILKATSISGTITLPEGAKYTTGAINFNIYFESVNTKKKYNSYHSNVIPTDKTEFKVTVPEGEDTYKLSINIWGNTDDSNIVKSTYMYYTGASFSAHQEDAQGISIKEDYEFYFPVYKTIKGKLSFPEKAYINEPGMTVYLYAKDTAKGSTISQYFYNFSDEKGMDFEFPVPECSHSFKIYAYIGAYSCDTNIVSGNYYYSTDGTVTTENSASEVSLGAQNIIITPQRKYSVSGKLNVPADYEAIGKITSAEIKLYDAASTGSSYLSRITAKVDENLNYTALLPTDKTGNIIFSVTPESSAVNNLVNKEYKHTQSFNVTGNSDVSGVNFTLETGYALRGTVKLPDDAVLSGVTYTPSVNAGGTSFKTGEITSEKRTAPFMIGVDKTKTSFRLYAKLSSPVKENVYSTNLYSSSVYYVSDTESTTNYSFATQLQANSLPNNVTILMQTGARFNFTLQNPAAEYSFATVCVEDEAKTVSFYEELYGSSSVITKEKELAKENIGKEVYVYYTILSGPENSYKQKIYINPDGSFTCFKKDAKMHTIGEQNNITLQMITNDNPIVPTYEFESLHNDSSNTNKDYTYTHPTEADYLEVTFSEDTYHNQITIYDKDGERLDTYTYSSLAGKTIKIKGNSFKINLYASSSSSYYGFAADVVAHNYVLSSEHPLTPNKETRYEYTYPDNADWLDITFSEETMLDEWYLAQLNIDSTDGNVQGFTRGELSGKTVRVFGNSFVIRVITGDCSDVYGFDIEKITPGYKVWHNVTFKNYDGTELYTQRVEDGLEAIYMGIKPYREMNGGKAYKFKGWDKPLTNITESVTLTAQFEEVTPVYISTEEELRTIENDTEGYYVLKNDIVLKENWSPIGGLKADLTVNAFKGVIEGNGHVISNANIPAVNNSTNVCGYRGFFSQLEDAVIRNLGIKNISFGGENDFHSMGVEIGGFACSIMRSRVENCFVEGSISTGSSMHLHAGGFAGSIFESVIENCYADVELTLRGHATAGGFAGDICMSKVRNALSLGKVSSDENTDPAMEDEIGAFCGMTPVDMETEVTNAYYISDYYSTSHYGMPVSKENAKAPMGFMNAAGDFALDFENIWVIDERIAEHPVLRYQAKALNEENGFIEASVRDVVQKNKLSVTCTVPSYEKGIFAIAAYRGKDMVGITLSQNGSFTKNGSGEITYESGKKPDRIKVMLWRDAFGLKPICEEKVISQEKWITE